MIKTPIVLTAYFNYKKDPQRKIEWDSDYTKVLPLIKSVVDKNVDINIFNNCFEKTPYIEKATWNKIEGNNCFNPNVYRHFVYLDFLKKNQDNISYVFMVDSTDVEMLKNPFNEIKSDYIYVGSESIKVGCKWMKETQGKFLNILDYNQIIEENKNETLINVGIVGGEVSLIINFLEKITYYHSEYSKNLESSSDMSIFNYTIWKHFKEKIKYGREVNTRFKRNERNDVSWWKHK